MLAQVDVDKNGLLDREELLASLTLPKSSGGWGYQTYQVDAFIRMADTDQSGTVSRSEFLKACAKHLVMQVPNLKDS